MDSKVGGPRGLRGPLILASASPRRREILGALGVPFEVEPSEVDEDLPPGIEPEEASRVLALRKAAEVAARHRGESGWVIGSDTIVAHGEGSQTRMLAKPADAAEARSMLERLSDSRHRVITGVCVVDLGRFDPQDPRAGAQLAHERTWVTMRPITPAEVQAYVASGEWQGKAGGYAIQENADAFVTALEEGGFDNVVGLPLELTVDLLEKAGAFLPA